MPAWNADVCCTFTSDAAHCSKTNARGRCPTSTSKRYCEHGSLASDGAVTCFQPFPDACEAGWCIEAPELIPEAQMISMIMCCNGGACQYVQLGQSGNCQGELLACMYAIEYADGTVQCLESE